MLKFNNKVLKILDKWLNPNGVSPVPPTPVTGWKLLVSSPTSVSSNAGNAEIIYRTWGESPTAWLTGSDRTEFRGRSRFSSYGANSDAYATINPLPAESEYNDYALYNLYVMYYAESYQSNKWSTSPATLLFDNNAKFSITPYSQGISPGGYYQNNCATTVVMDSNNNTLATFEFGNTNDTYKCRYVMNYKVLYDLNTKYSYVTCTPGLTYTPTDISTYKWYLLSTNAWDKSKLNGQSSTNTKFTIPPFDNTGTNWKQSGITWSYMEVYGYKGQLDIVLDSVTQHDYRIGI